MSINRKTQSYWKRVKALQKALRWRQYRHDENGRLVLKTAEDVISEHTTGAPRYLVEDALSSLIEECRRSAEYSEDFAREEREIADEMERRLVEIRRPKLKLASRGDAA